MTTITIDQKMSNTGSIYDIASDCYDRVINMGKDFEFAVVLPSYYGDVSSRHKSSGAAISQYEKLTREGYQGVTILNRAGDEMIIHHHGNSDGSHRLVAA